MHPNYYWFPLAIALALGLVSPVKAVQPVVLQKISLEQLMQKFELLLPGATQGSSISRDSLKWVRQHRDSNKITHIRMQQYYAGFAVFGGYAIIHSKKTSLSQASSRAKVAMNGSIYQGLDTELGKPEASFLKDSSLVLQQFKAPYPDKIVSEEQVIPMVYIDGKHQAHWAYKVSLFINHKDKMPEQPTAIIDAKTKKPFIQWNDIKTEKVAVKGTGFGGNTKVGKYRYGRDLPLLELSRETDTKMCFMENVDVQVIDMHHQYHFKNTAMEFFCDKDLGDQSGSIFLTGYFADGYDKENGASSPTNDALYAGYVVKHMYHDWYGIEALTTLDGSPMKLVMRVHYGEGYENAFWDSIHKRITFGDGDTRMYPLASLGISGHEVSHGFTEQYSALEYVGQSGGINESFSDMAAQAAEFYSVGKNNWQIGFEIMKEESGIDAVRYMNKPSLDGISIDTADEYYDDLDVHYSSGVFNHLFYLLATRPNWDTRKAFDMMVKANMDYWTPYTSFDEAACGVISAARDLGFALDDVKKSLEEVALDPEACLIDL